MPSTNGSPHETILKTAIENTRNKETLAMLWMCKSSIPFSLGDISILEGQETMALVKKDDKYLSCWNATKKG